jgi:hypothetical protein
VTGQWFSPDPPVSSTNKTDRHDIAEILLKVTLNTIKQTTKLSAGIFMLLSKPKSLTGFLLFDLGLWLGFLSDVLAYSSVTVLTD